MIITTLSAEERIALKKAKEETLIANIDRAIDGGPKLSHPPVYDDYADLLSFWEVVQTIKVRQSARVKAEVQYQKAVHVAARRR